MRPGKSHDGPEGVVPLAQLEQRRSELAGWMWQAPALTVAAQAFLLFVLTDPGLGFVAGVLVLSAGLVTVAAAIFSLLRLRAREVRHSDVIGFYLERQGIEDPRSTKLQRKRLPTVTRAQGIDRWLQEMAEKPWWPAAHLLWAAALALFAIADVAAFVASQ